MSEQLEKVELPLMWNVIDSSVFQSRAKFVFSETSKVLRNTLGPYGTTTIIARPGGDHFTKDGWNVLKNIHFSDRIEESMLQLIINIASQVVTRVGDGSTSSVVASSYLYEELSKIIGSERPKEIITRLNKAVNLISDKVSENAIKIDKEDLTYEDIYRIALVSTNGDEKVARIIQTIYQETGNPDIEYRIGRNGDHDYTIINGYQSPITALDEVFLTDGNGSGNYRDALVILFDHRIDQQSHMDFLNEVLDVANQQNRPLFLAAHGYDKQMMEWIKIITERSMQMGAPFSLITGYAKLLNGFDHAMYQDLAVLTGGKVVTEATMSSYNQREYKPVKIGDEETQELVRSNPDMNGADYVGYASEIVIGRNHTVFTGFPKVNENLLNIQRRDAAAKLAEFDEREETYGVVNHDINRARDRVSRLSCKVGIFNIGGHNHIERNSEKDLIEDAIKAAASAFKYGYNIGNNLAIRIAIDELMKDDSLDLLDKRILGLISNAFLRVLKDVYRNWDEAKVNDGFVDEVVDRAINTGQSFDIVKQEYNNNVINPTRTDIEILHGALSIISMVINSNQYISTTPEFLVTPNQQ